MNENTQEFYWTIHPEDHWFNGPHASREAALQDGRKQHTRSTIFTGIFNRPHLCALMPDGGDIIEHLRNQASDFGDTDNEWLNYVKKGEIEDLTARVQAVVKAWLEGINEIPTFGTIEDVQESAAGLTEPGHAGEEG